MSERTPLLHYRLSASVNESGDHRRDEHEPRSPATDRRRPAAKQPPKLNTFFGVVIPTLLSMFSVVVFLRIGFVVGQCGLYQTIAMLLVAYFIISMTVLSVCAISTNGALDAGGAYYMISRALGPEFGGSIGIMFFLANVCGSALFVLGLVEAILTTFGISDDGSSLTGSRYAALPTGYWWSLLYGTVILLLCVLVCLVGAHIYAKATFLIFIIVMVVLGTIFISFFAVPFRTVQLPGHRNASLGPTSANFTGFKLDTLLGNVQADYVVDYTTGVMMSFATVFAVMFNGCTGIMAGSNMSGDLKNPSYSIPRGTITAVIFTFVIYNLLSILISCTCDRVLLQQDYGFLTDINVWHPLVTVGVYSSTLSAAMSNLIGASRILYALARDNLLGRFLSPAKHTSASGNPWVSVLISWIFVQLVLFSGKLNTIASIVTIFFLLVYAAVDLACLALEWASAPNFRPTFRYFTWHTCVLGIMGCAVMMFLINAIYASASIAFMLLLLLLIHYLSPVSSWGFISQALIFHQVQRERGERKKNNKFWFRFPDTLPALTRGLKIFSINLYGGTNSLSVFLSADVLPSDPLQSQYDSWLSLVDHLNIKAFVNLTLADSVRHGVQHLLFISGLGGMRPNTLVLGFYDDIPPQDLLQDSSLSICKFTDNSSQTDDPEDQNDPPCHFPPVRGGVSVGRGGVWGGKSMGPQEYVCVIADAVKMLKNVALARYFGQFDRTQALQGPVFVDVWPVNLLRPDSAAYVDTCSLFLLQLACILNMTRAWQKAKLRLFLCVEEGRIALHWQRQTRSEKIEEMESEEGGVEADEVFANSFPSNTSRVSDEYLQAVNKLILDQTLRPPAVRFLYLPRPPADTSRYHDYLNQLELLTRNLGPTLLIHGVTPVITTDL
uniref:Solute carrier family 12 member 9 n=1 Tax=Sinocyclocheilus grahami TaxID=75366 RepID=A0A672SWS2_SINGR